MRNSMQYVTGAALGLTLFGLVWAADARADGYDPDLMKNTGIICEHLTDADSINDVLDMISVFGGQYTMNATYNGCKENGMKVIAGLTYIEQHPAVAEDDLTWNCEVDGDTICGRVLR